MTRVYLNSVSTIIDETSKQLGIPVDLIKDPSQRTPAISHARHIAMYLASTMTYKSKRLIAEEFNCADHTTVLRAINKVAIQQHDDKSMKNDIESVKKVLMAKAK